MGSTYSREQEFIQCMNTKQLRKYLQNGIDINYVNTKIFKCGALHYAALHANNIKVIQFLIDNGADINLRNHVDATPLHYAIVNRCCNCDSNANCTSNANSNNNNDYVIDPNRCCNNCLDIIKLLLENGADVNAKTINNITVLRQAIQENSNPKVVELLLSYGASFDINYNHNIVEKLTNFKHNDHHISNIVVDGVSNSSMKSTIDYDVDDTNYQIARRLRTAYDNNFFRNEIFNSLLLMNITVEQSNKVNCVVNNDRGWTYLHEIIIYNKYNPIPLLQLLLLHNADINSRDFSGRTILHLSVSTFSDKLILIKFLIANNADINSVDNDGNTVLHYFIRSLVSQNSYKTYDSRLTRDSYTIIEYLFRNGLNINARNVDGNTAIDFAKQIRHFNISQFLEEVIIYVYIVV